MKACRGVQVQLHTFLNSSRDEGEHATQYSLALPEESTRCTQWRGGSVNPGPRWTVWISLMPKSSHVYVPLLS